MVSVWNLDERCILLFSSSHTRFSSVYFFKPRALHGLWRETRGSVNRLGWCQRVRIFLLVMLSVIWKVIFTVFYFGGARSKGFATLRNVPKFLFWDMIVHAKSVGFRFYSAIWQSESRISSRYLEITSISLIYSLTFSRKKELLFWLSRDFNYFTKWDQTTSWYLEITSSLIFNYSRNK